MRKVFYCEMSDLHYWVSCRHTGMQRLRLSALMCLQNHKYNLITCFHSLIDTDFLFDNHNDYSTHIEA